MKRYQSHKTVEAAKITNIKSNNDITAYILSFEDDLPIEVSDLYMQKHKPEVGGYFVRYPDSDGYISYSPAGPFERGNTELT